MPRVLEKNNMKTEEIYIRDKFVAFKTDKETYDAIIEHYGSAKRISKFQYRFIIALRKVLQYILFPLWALLFFFHILFDKFNEWYEKFLDA